MIEFNCYDDARNFTINYTLPDKVEEISFSCDGGRVCLYINGVEVFFTTLGGNDCSVDVNNE